MQRPKFRMSKIIRKMIVSTLVLWNGQSIKRRRKARNHKLCPSLRAFRLTEEKKRTLHSPMAAGSVASVKIITLQVEYDAIDVQSKRPRPTSMASQNTYLKSPRIKRSPNKKLKTFKRKTNPNKSPLTISRKLNQSKKLSKMWRLDQNALKMKIKLSFAKSLSL